jgi:hypothetical protein
MKFIPLTAPVAAMILDPRNYEWIAAASRHVVDQITKGEVRQARGARKLAHSDELEHARPLRSRKARKQAGEDGTSPSITCEVKSPPPLNHLMG